MKITDSLNNKKILIWGYGREGKSTSNFIDKYCHNTEYEIYEGDISGIEQNNYDLIIKSPGIPYLVHNDKITSQTKLFLNEFRDQIIAFTGSKGKSTTSSLMYHVLQSANYQTVLVGNIGYPCFDCYEQIHKDTLIVFEISAHQLFDINASPHISSFLNLYEEHLDYYGNIDNYFNAKANITKYQTSDDYFLCSNKIPNIDTKAKKIFIDTTMHFDMKLLGEHNQHNANFVYYIANNILSIDKEIILSSISNFEPLKHRIEYLGSFHNIDYYDDSISTIPQATINAINSISNIQTVLIGGMDRGIDYSPLIEFISKHNEYNYIFMYQSGKRIYNALEKYNNIFLVDDLKQAVALSKKITDNDKACLLSPAAASYDSFKNFEERGDAFASYVKGK